MTASPLPKRSARTKGWLTTMHMEVYSPTYTITIVGFKYIMTFTGCSQYGYTYLIEVLDNLPNLISERKWKCFSINCSSKFTHDFFLFAISVF